MSFGRSGGPGALAPAPDRRSRTRTARRLSPRAASARRPALWRLVILVLAAIFFLMPLLAAIKFSLLADQRHYGFEQLRADHQQQRRFAARSHVTGDRRDQAILVVVLMLPTVVLVRLKLPKLTLLMEGITILPIVVPPIVIAAGLAAASGQRAAVAGQRSGSTIR